ncbi:MAG TPA: DNA primase [Dongiaceae bacterium]|nr:DNA primase [Dongiaceae bacterium]
MAFPAQFLDELRNRLSIAEVVGRRVRLQKRGREHVGLCPFHNEKTPSFTVSEEKGFFHCFGCGAHGDVVGFVMRADGLAFPEAVERLAEQAGLPVPASSPEERGRAQRQATLHAVNEAAATWFERQLRGAGGRVALDYLKGRGIEEQTVGRFRLGYAPDSRGALKAALQDAGFPEPLAVEAGLLIRPDGGGACYDRFRGRVMFPIADRRGRVIAFGGRTLGDGEPKYLNSPETPLFHKGRVLYGLAQAMRPSSAASEPDELVVVEGYMDVIALVQAGAGRAVAPLGTALTEEQIARLWRLAPEPVLCFDGDAAGQRAAARAADRALPLLAPGRSLRFALLPPGDDPDSLIRAHGREAMREIVERAGPLVALLWELETAGRAFDTPERRAGLRQRLYERLRRIADRSVEQAYRIEMDRRLDEAFGRGPVRPGGRSRPAAVGPGGGQAARRGTAGLGRQQQEILLATVVNHPGLLTGHAEELAGITLPAAELDGLRRAIIDLAAGHPDLDTATLKGHLTRHGFSRVLDALLINARRTRFAGPEAPAEEAGAGLAHVLGLMREREAEREVETAMRRLGEHPTEETHRRLQEQLRARQDGESRRLDLDRDEAPTVRAKS